MSDTTVLIPAHNEADVIAQCVRTLLSGAAEDEFEVLVLSNGSSDATVNVAEAECAKLNVGPMVRVLDISEPGKANAINVGVKSGRGPNFIVLDADVALESHAVRELANALRQPGVFAASSAVRLDFDGISSLSRSYHRFWQQLPTVVNGLAGRGVYGLSEAGIARLGPLPLIIADDRYVDLCFGMSERIIVSSPSTVVPTKGVRQLITRKSRVFLGNQRLDPSSVPFFDPTDRPSGGWIAVAASNPRSVKDLPVYLGVNLVAKSKAKWMARGRNDVAWDEDRSS